MLTATFAAVLEAVQVVGGGVSTHTPWFLPPAFVCYIICLPTMRTLHFYTKGMPIGIWLPQDELGLRHAELSEAGGFGCICTSEV
jgi:hypothetical protein